MDIGGGGGDRVYDEKIYVTMYTCSIQVKLKKTTKAAGLGP
jgi:hypothetical protein